jgi:RNA polymerase sigma-70 factor (ECF subfamily)
LSEINSLGNEIRKVESIFKQEIEPYRTDLWKYCLKLTRSPWDAEDLVQETLLKAFSVLAKLFQPINTKAYLFKIATNLWIDHKRNPIETLLSFEDQMLYDYNSLNNFTVIENLDLLVKYLTPTQYVGLILADVFLFKGKEIAEIMATSEGAVHTNLSRARQVLKTQAVSVSLKYNEKKLKPIKDHINTNPTIELLLEGFRKKDPQLIASLLADNVVTDITHSGIEFGKEETKKNSLRDWTEIVLQQGEVISEYVELWGRPVILELEKKQDNILYLNNIHYIEVSEDKISYWKFYCFSWDLINLAADELGVRLNATYFYHIF